jgi:signal transduction histidine kinase
MLALAVVAAAAVAGATYASVRAEADALFDYHLRQMALSLRDQGRIADDERAALANLDFDYVVQVWSLDGVVLYSSLPRAQTQPLPTRAVLGFSTVDVAGVPWRVFGAATPLRVVQVGQPLGVRRQRAAAAAWRSVLPIALAAPVVALLLWWLVGLSLAPLARVAAAARSRDVHALEPLPLAGLPSEVHGLVEAFNALLLRLGAAFKAQRAFVDDAAHELRTPLTALKLQLGLLRNAAAGADQAAALSRMQGGIERATRLVEQLLALARAEPGSAPAPGALDLATLARQTLADVAPLSAARDATVALDAPPTLPWRGDAQSLLSLLRNLLDNALRHAGPAPHVQLGLQPLDGAVRIRVDDNGPGIPPSDRERVFDRFHRGEGRGGEGSGLGLAIVRAIATQAGGQVTLGDAPLGGLRVDVVLPAS